MRPRIRLILTAVAALAGLPALAQTQLRVVDGGSGIDGSLTPTANLTIDTTAKAIYEYTTIDIPAEVTVTVVGPNPAIIKVCGDVNIDGVLSASGQAGGSSSNNSPGGSGGAGGPGGAGGGDGGERNPIFNGMGAPGSGPSPGQPGVDGGTVGGPYTEPVGGGGGGGNATAGQDGGLPNSGSTPSASGSGGPAVMPPIMQSSGGGGGGGDLDSATNASSNDGGGGGGGGGGTLSLWALGTITVAPGGAIRADGGAGGDSAGNGGGGGGGSGGVLEIRTPLLVVNFGTISAIGGAGGAATQTQYNCGCSPGGAGGDGFITIFTCSTGTMFPGITPAPSVNALAGTGPLNLGVNCPAGTIAVCGSSGNSYLCGISGALIPPVPVPPFADPFEIDISDPLFLLTFPMNTLSPLLQDLSGTIPGMVTVDLSSADFPPGTAFSFYAQAISTDFGGVLNGLTNTVTVNASF
jgi:hypothetical protein